jgi:hypothetical protein
MERGSSPPLYLRLVLDNQFQQLANALFAIPNRPSSASKRA